MAESRHELAVAAREGLPLAGLPQTPLKSVLMRRALVTISTVLLLILPTPAGRAMERPCSRFEVRSLVHTFVEAYNRGDVEYLEKIWAQEPDFFWYFVDSDVLRRGEALSKDRTTLAAYFTQRSMFADRIKVAELNVAWERGWHGAWDITFEAVRRSDEAGASGRYHGKGAAECQRLIAWSMGREP